MTDKMMSLPDLVVKTPDADVVRHIGSRLMELEVGGLTGAAYGEKTLDRLVQVHDPGPGLPDPVPVAVALNQPTLSEPALPLLAADRYPDQARHVTDPRAGGHNAG